MWEAIPKHGGCPQMAESQVCRECNSLCISRAENREAIVERAVYVDEAPEIKLLRSILSTSLRRKPKLSTYDDSLVADPLMGWISELDKYSKQEEIEEYKQVKFDVTRLKGHVALCWDNVQVERRKKEKPFIKSWNWMITNMKGKFLPKYYQLSIYRQVNNHKQRLLKVREYMEEFYRVNLRAGYVEDTPEKTTKYINGLKLEI